MYLPVDITVSFVPVFKKIKSKAHRNTHFSLSTNTYMYYFLVTLAEAHNMKYLQVVAAPSPIESWLHSQLEARGVDRVYSRYILSLFQSTDVDQDFLDLDIPSKVKTNKKILVIQKNSFQSIG